MTDLLITEAVFLLGHDDETGKNRVAKGLTGALAGGLLLDLALAGLIKVDKRHVIPAVAEPAGHPLLATSLEVIGAERKERSVSVWLAMLPRRIKHLDRVVGTSLVGRGILAEQQAKVLGLITVTRWPERDPGPERALRAHLTQVLLDQVGPTDDDIVLVALLQSYDLARAIVDKPDRRQARHTAERLRKQAERGDAVSRTIGQTVRATQAAVLSGIVAANAASAAAATSVQS